MTATDPPPVRHTALREAFERQRRHLDDDHTLCTPGVCLDASRHNETSGGGTAGEQGGEHE